MFDSIRTRLTLWYAGVLALLIIGFALMTYFFVSRILIHETDKNLLEMSENFASAIYAEQNYEAEEIPDQEAIAEIIKEFKFQDYQIYVLSTDGKIIAKTSEEDFPLDFPENSYSTIHFNQRNFRVFITSLKAAKSNYKLLIYRDLTEQDEIKNRLRFIFLIAIPVTLLLAIWLGFWLAKRSLRPVEEMSEKARKITANNLSERLLVQNERDEIGNLTNVFNGLLERLDKSFEQQRRFMTDASHELRTPLAIVLGESEVVLSKESRSNEELRESLAIINDESKRLTKLVEDLFTLSRADAGQFKTNFKQVYLDEILAESVRNIQVLAGKKNLSLNFSAVETEISGDEQLLRRLFLNLLDNAVKYNRKGGSISINLASRIVTISDTGCGISQNEQSKIFERFYRTDKSRRRIEESGGAGLGLSIAKWIAELHQAELKLEKSDESGSIFIVIFPR